MALKARPRSAVSETIIALLPPSSSSERPRRAPTVLPTSLPMAVEPVAETSGNRLSSAIFWPISRPPMITLETPRGISGMLSSALFTTAWQASAHKGAFSEGLNTMAFPHTRPIMLFHDQTAIGKLNAVITATSPRGCHCSIMRCPGRSLTMVLPCSCRDSPTAKSQTSIHS